MIFEAVTTIYFLRFLDNGTFQFVGPTDLHLSAIWIIHNISSVHIITVVILGIIHMAERFMSVVPTNWNAPLSKKQRKYLVYIFS